MTTIQTSNEDLLASLEHDGSKSGDIQERCCLCRVHTPWWHGHGAENVALCPTCALTHTKSDLPTKDEWFAKERALTKSFY